MPAKGQKALVEKFQDDLELVKMHFKNCLSAVDCM